MQSNKSKFVFRFLFFLTFAILFSGAFVSLQSQAASSVKVKYNGKTHKNKSKKLNVKYNSKTVTKKSYKALIIKKSYMAPYTDVFKSGMKATCKYSKSKKTLTISKNSVTIKMKVGSKTAYVNGKATKMTTAPLSVRYVSKKKTKILVPVYFVAKNLKCYYSKTKSTIMLKAPLQLQYDGNTVYYTGVQGSVYYNHTNYVPSTMPVLKIGSSMYIPAQEILEGRLKLEYDYNSSNGQITVANDELGIDVSLQVNSNKMTVNEKTQTMSAPVKVIKNVKTNQSVVCVPAANVLKALNYTRSWNKTAKYYSIQSKLFFDWNKELSSKQTANTATNYIHKMKASYSAQSGMGAIDFSISGSVADIMKTTTVKRSGNVITVTFPTSEYILDKNSFSNFGEIVSKIDATTTNSTTTLTITCDTVSDYSYIVQNGVLELNILYTYGSSNGSVTNYSLSIKKPANVSIANVTNQDLYASKKFNIIISGDYVEFYRQNPIIINNNTIKNVSVAKSGANTVITVTTSSLRGYKIYEQGNNFVVSMGSPKSIYKSIVVLDPGHGGYDSGARNKGTNEKDLNFKILYTLMKKYCSGNAPDIKVYWTRTTDTFISLANRAAFAKSVEADVFISLHMNSASTSANGTEVYYSVSNNSTSFNGISSKKMATLFKDKLVSDLGTKNRGTKTAAYYVLKHNTVPSILIELGFLSGSSDYTNLINASFQEKAAKSIYDGIVTMFATYPTGR